MSALKYCAISNKGYGQKWQNFRLYYEGPRPKLLRDDGAFSSGKSLLEALAAHFKDFELILTPEESRIQSDPTAPQVYLAVPQLREMNARLFVEKKIVTQRAVDSLLSGLFPKHFTGGTPVESAPKRPHVKKRKPKIGLRTLQRLAKELKKRIRTDQSVSRWQEFLKENILALQQGYIALLPKAKLGALGSGSPDFFLITHDGYVDILEIKTPATPLLSTDPDDHSDCWSPEVAAAIAQVEKRLEAVVECGEKLRAKVKEGYGIELPLIKPRAIIFAGNSGQLTDKKQEAFEQLTQALQQVSVVTYDELLTRLQNQITALHGMNGK